MTQSYFRFRNGRERVSQLLLSGVGSISVHALNRLLALGSGIVLARTLGPEGYGLYSYAFAIMGLLLIATQAGVPTLLLREVSASKAQGKWGFLRGALVRGSQIVFLASIVIMTIGLIVLSKFRPDLDRGVYLTYLYMLIALPAASLAKATVGAIIGLQRIAVGQTLEMLFQPSLMLIVVVTIFLVAPAMRLPDVAMFVQFITLLVLLATSAYFLFRLLPLEAKHTAIEYPSARWMRNTVPFTLIGGAAIINSQADILMLGWLRSSDEVGVYRVTSQCAMLVGFVLQAASAVAGPHFSSLYVEGDLDRLAKLLRKTAVLACLGSVPIALTFIIFGAEILELLFGDEYASGGLILAILAVGYLANVSFGPVGLLLQMVGYERLTARVLWMTAILNLILNALLIPSFGLVGAALSTAVSITLYHAILRRLIRINIGV